MPGRRPDSKWQLFGRGTGGGLGQSYNMTRITASAKHEAQVLSPTNRRHGPGLSNWDVRLIAWRCGLQNTVCTSQNGTHRARFTLCVSCPTFHGPTIASG